jgi:hypothetical protein
MTLLGTVSFFLIYLFNMQPLFEYVNVNKRPGVCFGLTCTNTYLGNIIRYSGFFDEPGTIANWGIWALLMNKLLIKNKKIELLLIISLIFTFSMAFYVQLLLYIAFFYLRFNIKVLIILLVITLCGMFVYSLKDENSPLYKFTLERYQLDDSGSIKGDNRSNQIIFAKKEFLNSPIIGIGARNFANKSTKGSEPMSQNIFLSLGSDGIIGFVGTYLYFFFILIYRKRRNDSLKYLVIIAIGFIQRPILTDVFSVVSLMVIYSLFMSKDEDIEIIKKIETV